MRPAGEFAAVPQPVHERHIVRACAGCGNRAEKAGDQLASARRSTGGHVHPGLVGSEKLSHDPRRLTHDGIGGLPAGRRTPQVDADQMIGAK
jgi:hypothetical protein